MGIVKKLKVKSPRKISVDFGKFYPIDNRTDGDAGGFIKSEMCINLKVDDGTLKTSWGVADMEKTYPRPQGERPRTVYFYKRNDYASGKRDDRILVYCNSGAVYEYTIGGSDPVLVNGLEFSVPPKGVCYNYNSKDVIIMSAEGEGLKIYDGETVTSVPDAPSITSMCIHAERLFVTSGGVDGALWFSDDFDPTNWNVSLSEAGFIDMSDPRGDMICAVSFAGYVYVFRSYGVSRVTAFSDQSEFSVSHLLVSCGKIMQDSVVVCGDRILFFASDGLYSFDGVSAVKISEPWQNMVNFDIAPMKGVYYSGYAYYVVVFNNNGKYERGVLKISPTGKDCSFAWLGYISDLMVVDGEDEYSLYTFDRVTLKFCKAEEGAGYMGETVPTLWYSKETNFGVESTRKRLAKLSFNSNVTTEITVWADGKEYVFNAIPQRGRCVITPNIIANKFRFFIFAREMTLDISDLKMEITYYD